MKPDASSFRVVSIVDGCRVANRAPRDDRNRRLWDQPIDYVYHESFDRPRMRADILGPTPEAPPQKLASVPAGAPGCLAGLYGVALLSAGQEAHLFRKMNYLKHHAARLRKRLRASRATAGELDRVEVLLRQSQEVRGQLVRANLRLVVSVVKKFIRAKVELAELLSDGNMSLLKAVDTFDFSRGFRFSTYAFWVIRNNFRRSIPVEYSRRERFRTGTDLSFDGTVDHRSDEFRQEQTRAQDRETVNRILGHLDDRERNVLISRFGLRPGSDPQTLEQVGARQGVSKERIRQIERRALDKLRQLAAGEGT